MTTAIEAITIQTQNVNKQRIKTMCFDQPYLAHSLQLQSFPHLDKIIFVSNSLVNVT